MTIAMASVSSSSSSVSDINIECITFDIYERILFHAKLPPKNYNHISFTNTDAVTDSSSYIIGSSTIYQHQLPSSVSSNNMQTSQSNHQMILQNIKQDLLCNSNTINSISIPMPTSPIMTSYIGIGDDGCCSSS